MSVGRESSRAGRDAAGREKEMEDLRVGDRAGSVQKFEFRFEPRTHA
jgi:hypothetical protein